MIIKCEECSRELNVTKKTVMKMCGCGHMNDLNDMFIQLEGGEETYEIRI